MNSLKKITLIISLSLIPLVGVQADELDDGLKLLDKGEFKEAATLFAKSFENKKPDGGFYLGRMFELGIGTDADIRRSASIYSSASKLGSHKASNRLAMLYLEGKGVLQDYKQAAEYFKKAAEGEDKDAQFNYGVMFEKGMGVKKDLSKSVKWYEKSANKGHIAAQNMLAIMYQEGNGVSKSKEKSMKWFAKSAQKGNALGLYSLGKYFSEDDGKKKADLEKAYVLFNLASVGGHPDAMQQRKSVSKSMSPEQLAKAQMRSKKWLDAEEEKREVFF